MEYNPYDNGQNQNENQPFEKYSNYTQNPYDFNPAPKKKRQPMSGAGCFLICFFGFIVLAIAVGMFATPFLSFTGEMFPTESQQGSLFPSNNPEITPNVTTRPAPTYDGNAPLITDYTNPFPDIIDNVSKGVVSICNYSDASKETLVSSGSGFLFSSEGYIITNAHVVEGSAAISVITTNEKELDAELIGYDKTSDIAVLKVFDKTSLLSPLYLGNSSNIRVGEFVITIGDPSGIELAGSATFGIVSSVSRNININGHVNEYIQTDAAMNPGNSGGPLINSKGEVIGVTSAKTVTASYDEFGNAISAEGLGFAIPINSALKVAEQIITKGYIERPGIGISAAAATVDELAAAKVSNGIKVASVIENGPSAKAGILAGDVITKCNGKAIHSVDQFVELIRNVNVGDTITVEYSRAGEIGYADIIVGDLNKLS